MVVKFSIFERRVWDFDKGPKVGDYVFCRIIEDSDEDQLKSDDFLRKNFGKVIAIEPNRDSGASYKIGFKNRLEYDVNNQLAKGFEEWENVVYMFPEELIFWSEDIFDLELQIDAKKYNV